MALRGDVIYVGDAGGRMLKIENGKVTVILELEFPCG